VRSQLLDCLFIARFRSIAFCDVYLQVRSSLSALRVCSARFRACAVLIIACVVLLLLAV
jgi:hypothetical protein